MMELIISDELVMELTKSGPLGRNIDWNTENRPMDAVREGEDRMHWESSTDIYTLSCVSEGARGKQPYNTGSSVWCSHT